MSDTVFTCATKCHGDVHTQTFGVYTKPLFINRAKVSLGFKLVKERKKYLYLSHGINYISSLKYN
jgi:hypothetical protein